MKVSGGGVKRNELLVGFFTRPDPHTVAIGNESDGRRPGRRGPARRELYTAIVGNGCRMPHKDLQKKTSVAFDDRTLKTFRKTGRSPQSSVSAFLPLVAAKLESGEIRV